MALGARKEGAASPVDLAEVRLVRRARLGEPLALGSLWERVVDPAWSVASALLPRERAFEVIRTVRTEFRACLKMADPESAWRHEVWRSLWAILWAELELPPLAGIDTGGWRVPIQSGGRRRDLSAAEQQRRIRAEILKAPRELQVIYLFDLFSSCSVAMIAEFSGASEQAVRSARTSIAYRLVNALRS